MVSQRMFSKSANANSPSYAKTIIPDNTFVSLQEFNHISTIEMRFDEYEIFQFQIRRVDNMTNFHEIFTCRFNNEQVFLRLKTISNDTVVFESDFLKKNVVLIDNFSLQLESESIIKIHQNNSIDSKIL